MKAKEPNARKTNADHDAAGMVLMNNMNRLLRELRTRKIPMGLLHALINLHLQKDEDVRLGTLAASINVTTAAVTSISDAMEELGFARRLVSKHDRRTIWLRLTPEGADFAKWLCTSMLSGIAAGPVVEGSEEQAAAGPLLVA